MTPLDCWQAFMNVMWILAPPTPYEWLCTETPIEPSLGTNIPELGFDEPARAIQLDEALCELMPLPALTDATQSFLLTTDPPIDVITFV